MIVCILQGQEAYSDQVITGHVTAAAAAAVAVAARTAVSLINTSSNWQAPVLTTLTD